MYGLRIIGLLALLLFPGFAIAQGGPGGGSGSGPSVNQPWLVNGGQIYYNNGCVTVPASVVGGCKSGSSINATTLWQAGNQALDTSNYGTSGATIPRNNSGFTQSGTANFTGAFQVNGNVITWPAAAITVARIDAAQTLAGLQTFSRSVVVGAPSGGDQGVGTVNATGVFINGIAVSTSAANLTVGTSTITSGAPTRILYDNAGFLGEYVISGSGSVCMTTNCVMTSPAIGAASGTSLALGGAVLGSNAFAVTGTTALGATTITGSFTATGLVGNASLVNSATTVNGQTCALGGTCTITASATSLTIGVTTLISATPNGLLYDAAGSLGNLATGASGVLVTSAGGVPSISTTLPAGLSANSMTLPGAAVQGGTVSSLSGFSLRDTSAAFDLTIAATSSAALSAGRTLTLNVGNVAHTLALGTTANTITFPNLPSFTVITNGDTGTVTNAMLANSSVTVNGTAISLGASGTVTAAAGTLTGTTLNATVVTSSLTSVGALASGSLAAGFTPVSNALLANSSVTIGSTNVALGGTASTVAGLTLSSPTFSGTVAGANTIPLSILTQVTGGASFLGVPAASTGNVSSFTIASLANKAVPAGADTLVIGDSAATGALKNSTITQVFAAVGSGVTTFNGAAGAALLVNPPMGRITLISGVPAPVSSQAGATTYYYTPAYGQFIPTTLDGSTFQMTPFAEVSQTTTDTTKSPAAVIANANYDVYGWMDSGTFRVSRADYWKTGSIAVTMTVATPSVLTCGTCSFNLNYNQPAVLTGTVPGGFTAGTTYYVLPLTATTAQLSATPGGAALGNGTGSSSGITAVFGDDFGTVYRSGTTSLTTVKGILLNTATVTNGPAALRGTYLGTVRSDASATLNMTFGSVTAGGGPALLNVFNQYNQVPTAFKVGDSTANWTYSSGTSRKMNASAGNRVSVLVGTQGNPIFINRGAWMNNAAIATGAYSFQGIIIDGVASGDFYAQLQAQSTAASTLNTNIPAQYAGQLGAHFFQATESSDGTNANQFSGSGQGAFILGNTLQ